MHHKICYLHVKKCMAFVLSPAVMDVALSSLGRIDFLEKVQLDWTSCADTHKINLPRDREGYDGFEYTDEKLSTRRIHWCRLILYLLFLESYS